jgi:hypothetical protein
MRSALHSNFPTYDGSYPEVVFADFASEAAGSWHCAEPAPWPDDRLSDPGRVFEAVIQNVQLLNRETLTITQRIGSQARTTPLTNQRLARRSPERRWTARG